jgi:hypothetical protein
MVCFELWAILFRFRSPSGKLATPQRQNRQDDEEDGCAVAEPGAF